MSRCVRPWIKFTLEYPFNAVKPNRVGFTLFWGDKLNNQDVNY